MDTEFKSEEERKAAFLELRRRTHQQMDAELKERERINPTPTEVELRLGTYIEDIEPQLREAIKTFVEKGYCPHQSGFDVGGQNEMDQQYIDGDFHFTNEERELIESVGGIVTTDGWIDAPQMIRFKTQSPNLTHIKMQWDCIANVLPNRGSIAEPGPIHSFIRKTAPERIDLEKIALLKSIRLDEVLLSQTNPSQGAYKKYEERLQKSRTRLEEIETKKN